MQECETANQPWAHERRQNHAMADLVEVGLLFVRVFGRHKGLNYFRCTVVAPHVYRRVLLGRRRGGADEAGGTGPGPRP